MSSEIVPPTKGLLELKTRIQNASAEREVRLRAEQFSANRPPFERNNYEQFLKKQPLLSSLHLVSDESD